jgi:hypothetical protein
LLGCAAKETQGPVRLLDPRREAKLAHPNAKDAASGAAMHPPAEPAAAAIPLRHRALLRRR